MTAPNLIRLKQCPICGFGEDVLKNKKVFILNVDFEPNVPMAAI